MMMMTVIKNKRRLSFTSMIWNKGGAMMRNKRVLAGSCSRIHHPPLTQAIGGARDAAQPQAMARLRSFRLTRRMSSGVGGRGCARLRTDRRVDAT